MTILFAKFAYWVIAGVIAAISAVLAWLCKNICELAVKSIIKTHIQDPIIEVETKIENIDDKINVMKKYIDDKIKSMEQLKDSEARHASEIKNTLNKIVEILDYRNPKIWEKLAEKLHND